MSRLRILMNLLFLGPQAGGVGRYALELTGELARRSDVELRVLTTRDGIGVIKQTEWGCEVATTVLPFGRGQRVPYVAAAFAGVSVWGGLRRCDIVHSPANVGTLFDPGIRTVVTAHDLIWLHAGTDWGTEAEIRTMERAMRATLPRANRIIAISQWTQADLIESLAVDPKRIDVVPSGVRLPSEVMPDATAVREHFDLEGKRVILCVAQKRPYKRQDLIIRALPDLPRDVVAVLPGAPTSFEDDLRRLAEDLDVLDRVRFPTWIPDEELEALYREASLCVFPSQYEGFGLPVLEAMGRGVPVACATDAALPEAAGDAALLFDAAIPGSVTTALHTLLEDADLRQQLIEKGRDRAARFTWAQTAELTVAVYRRALGEIR